VARKPSKPPPRPCPECGKPTTLEGRFCKACGWDADLVESEDSYLDGVDIPQGWGPDEEEGAPPRRRSVLWIVAAVAALASFAYVTFR
jgi:hypothetical protein